jgi:GT2 family glycosyltransferase
MFYAWEKTYNFGPFGKEPGGAARLILKSVLDKIGGLRDMAAQDTDIDIRLAEEGYRSVWTSAVKTYHLRHLSVKKMINGQIYSGRARYGLGISLKRTLGHSVFRFRPLILNGWMLEWMNRKAPKRNHGKDEPE